MKLARHLCALFILIGTLLTINLEAHPSLNCESNIPGFTFLGDFEDAKYFLSNNQETWQAASLIAANNNGYLASINSADENNFLFNQIGEIVLIGLHDSNVEGNFEWDSGDDLTFNNLMGGNTSDNDYGVINFWDGSWNLVNQYVQKRFIMEIPCGEDPPNEDGIVISGCPQNISVQAFASDNYSVQVEWTLPTAVTDCTDGGLTVTQILGPESGDILAPTPTSSTVVYEFSDACGNVEVCFFDVFVYPETDQIICPTNITVTATSGQGAVVYYDEPVLTTYCNPNPEFEILYGLASGSVFPIGTTEVTLLNFLSGPPAFCQNTVNCNFTVTVLPENGGGDCPDELSGFTSIGEFGNSKYFLSSNQMTWTDASQTAVNNGGYLASISSQNENDFLADNINSIVLIGLNDAASEGSLQWDSGESLSYNNLAGGNSESNDYGVINFWDGSWGLVNPFVQKRFIIEVPCDSGPPSNDLPDLTVGNISGLASSGEVGTVVGFQFELSNIGQATVSGDYNINTYLSNDSNFSNDDVLVGEILTGATPVGAITVDGAITVPNQTEGDYFLIIVADVLGQVEEENENNNTTSASFRIDGENPPSGGDPFCSFDEKYPINSSAGFRRFEVSESQTGLFLKTVAYDNGPFNTSDFEYTTIASDGVSSSTNLISLPTSTSSNQGDFSYQSETISPTEFIVSLVDENGNAQWESTVVIETDDADVDQLVRYDLKEMSDHFIGFGTYHFGMAAKWRSFMYKLDLDGNLIWQRTYEEINYFPILNIYEEAIDGGTYVQFGNQDTRIARLRKIGSSGNLMWTTNMAGDLVSNRVIFGRESLDNSGVFFGVWAFSSSRGDVTKLSSQTGEEIWNTYLPQEFRDDLNEFAVNRGALSFIPTNDGGIVANVSFFSPTPSDLFQKYGRLDSNGDKVWSFDMPDNLVNYDPVLSLSDGGFIFGDYLDASNEVGLFYIDGNGSFSPDCENGPIGDCPTSVDGFTALGEFNGSSYFISNTDARPVDAQLIAEEHGGYLAVVESQDENDFLRPFVNGLAYIGMNDFDEEGVLEWNNGATVDFTNFDDCNICLPNSDNQDFVIMQSWNGGWSWSNFFNSRPYIIEIPCDGLQNNDNAQGRFFSQDDNDLVVVEVYPNPTVNNINVAIVSPFSKTINYQIYDVNGRGVHIGQAEMTIGENILSIDVSKLTAGLYHIYFPDAHTRKSSFRFMRIH